MNTVTRRPLNLTAAIELIRQDAIAHSVVAKKGDLWSTMLSQIKTSDSIDGKHADALQGIIATFLSQLDDGTVIALWAKTETGQADHDDLESFVADNVRMALEMELLDEVTKLAWEEADASQRHH
ncbi:MAG: hypothetical protein IH899_17690 [Planctomycetes bacterium]|nr:hypothetical protein [Planctomycetota bacterium]